MAGRGAVRRGGVVTEGIAPSVDPLSEFGPIRGFRSRGSIRRTIPGVDELKRTRAASARSGDIIKRLQKTDALDAAVTAGLAGNPPGVGVEVGRLSRGTEGADEIARGLARRLGELNRG